VEELIIREYVAKINIKFTIFKKILNDAFYVTSYLKKVKPESITKIKIFFIFKIIREY